MASASPVVGHIRVEGDVHLHSHSYSFSYLLSHVDVYSNPQCNPIRYPYTYAYADTYGHRDGDTDFLSILYSDAHTYDCNGFHLSAGPLSPLALFLEFTFACERKPASGDFGAGVR